MTYRVFVTRRSKVDATNIMQWLSDYSDEAPLRWYEDYLEALHSLKEFPARCPAVSTMGGTKGRKLRQLLFDHYKILFAIEGSAVRVYHVMHQKQKPRY